LKYGINLSLFCEVVGQKHQPDFDLFEELMTIKAQLLAAVKDWNTYRKLMMKK
jgi:hypothetical protein